MTIASHRSRFIWLFLLVVLSPACGGGGGGGDSSGGAATFGPFPGVVFIADQNVATQYELYASDWLGTRRVNLSGPLVVGGSVSIAYWSPDRAWVAFIADKDTPLVSELYVVPADGSTGAVKVSGTLVTGGKVRSAQWSPDSARIAFLADKTTAGTVELFTAAPTGGAAPVWVSGPLTPGGNVSSFVWSPDSSRLAYLADQAVAARFELYTAPPTTAGADLRVSNNLTAGQNVFLEYAWTFDSSRLIYSVAGDALYSAQSLAAGSGTSIGLPLTASGSLSVSSKSNLVGYVSGSTAYITPATTSVGTINLSTIAPAAASFNYIKFSPDGSRIAFYQSAGGYYTLFTVLANGTGKVQVGPADGYYAGGSPYDGPLYWSPDSIHIAFIDDSSGLEAEGKLYIEKADGSGGGSPAGIAQICWYGVSWSPQSDRVAYDALDFTLGTHRPFASDTVPNAPTLLDNPVVAGGDSSHNRFSKPTFSPNGLRVVHRSSRESLSHYELFSSAVDGSNSVKLSGPLVTGGNVAYFAAR